jgi:hypothetical protein
VGVLGGRNVGLLGGCPSSCGGLAPGPGFNTNLTSVPADGKSVLVGRFNIPLHINSKRSFHDKNVFRDWRFKVSVHAFMNNFYKGTPIVGSRSTAARILNLRTKLTWVVSFTPGRLCPRRQSLFPLIGDWVFLYSLWKLSRCRKIWETLLHILWFRIKFKMP